jgi:1,2-dihydroxy-3-keto-5-methylthiopentene dioxygenase
VAALVYFDGSGSWGETLVCDARVRAALGALGIEHGLAAPDGAWFQRRQEGASASSRIRCVVDGTSLIYLPHQAGWLGLLCEAGEWVTFPRGERVKRSPKCCPRSRPSSRGCWR